MNTKLNISDLNIKFGGKHAPKDKKLIELFKNAYSKKLLVRVASIKIEGIKPFSSYQPKISSAFRKHFDDEENRGNPPALYVYPRDDHFIMSDDYNAYFLYLEKQYSKIICVVLGDSNSKYITEISEPFVLPSPKVKVIG